MHKTHIFDQKNNAKKHIFPTYLPYFFRTVTGNKQFIYLGLSFLPPEAELPIEEKTLNGHFQKGIYVWCLVLYMGKMAIFGSATNWVSSHHVHNAMNTMLLLSSSYPLKRPSAHCLTFFLINSFLKWLPQTHRPDTDTSPQQVKT